MADPAPWPSSAAAGLSPAAVRAFVERVKTQGLEVHGLSVWRSGRPVVEGHWFPYQANTPHQLNSVSKSFVSSAVGLCIADGRLGLHDRLLDLFPEERGHAAPGVDDLTVRHLLTMSSGHAAQLRPLLRFTPGANWVRTYLAQPLAHAPGTHFLYDSADTFLLSALVGRVTGGRVLEYLRPRLLEPLGIRTARWVTAPDGNDAGGWGMSLTTGDLARFGELYRCSGHWQGRSLLDTRWVTAATGVQISTDSLADLDWRQGYGYQFWRCRHGAYRADGMYGQYVLVLPEQEAVIGITAGTHRMQALLDVVWETLLLGFEGAPPSRREDSALEDAVSGLALALPFEPAGSRDAQSCTFALPPGLQFFAEDQLHPAQCLFWTHLTVSTGEGGRLTFTGPHGQHSLQASEDSWFPQTIPLFSDEPQLDVAAHAAWRADGAYQFTVRLLPTLRECRAVYRPGAGLELHLPAPLEQAGEVVYLPAAPPPDPDPQGDA